MASTLTNLVYHMVFSTKNRHSLIHDELEDDLYPYLGGIVRGEKGRLLEVGGIADHVHLLAVLPPSISVSEMLQRIKGNSSRWVNAEGRSRGRFARQTGYGAFTVSESAVPDVKAYIQGQEDHHRQMTFKEEFILLLKKHNVDYDERYIWD